MKRKKVTRAGAVTTMIMAAAVMLLMPAAALAGDLEPGAAPGSTMHTLDEIYEKCVPAPPSPCEGAPVEKTGQTTPYATGDDGYLEKGVEWPSPRFTDNADGTVTDNLTGLIWLKDAGCFGLETWQDALSACNGLASGSCGLSDGSIAGDWRLPNIKEIQSLVDFGSSPALPTSHLFINMVYAAHWSGTTYHNNTSLAWYVDISNGNMRYLDKTTGLYVLAVKDN